MGRSLLTVGVKYELHTTNGDRHGKVLECISRCCDDVYSAYTCVIRSTLTGWTMTCHGINMYPDGSIDWDFSTDGMFTTVDDNGLLHQI